MHSLVLTRNKINIYRFVTIEQHKCILNSYARKSKLRRLKRKVETLESCKTDQQAADFDDIIKSQKGPFESVEAGLLHFFRTDEIRNHSATGKKPN